MSVLGTDQDDHAEDTSDLKGPIAWMARNTVAANLLMIVLMIGGLLLGRSIKQEVFPEATLNWISVAVPYPGSSPEESEEIATSIEQAVVGVDGVKQVISSANEGSASVSVELLESVDSDRALADIKNAVDRITTFPQDAEEPQVSLLVSKYEVISLAVYGSAGEGVLRAFSERLRDGLKALDDVTQVDLQGARAAEIHIEVEQDTLRKYGLTLGQVADRVRMAAGEVPAGGVKTAAGEVLLRTRTKPTTGADFRALPLQSTPGGLRLTVDDVANVRDDFVDSDQRSTFNGQQAVLIKVFRVGDQTPIEVADAVLAHLKGLQHALPDGIAVTAFQDFSEMYRERMDLMLRNAGLGFILVLVVLGLFLEIRLAFWVTLGIPISFLGAMLLMPTFDVSINMISMFAFIVTLGMVVDDAIVVGENAYNYRLAGMSPVRAAIMGAKDVAKPVTFSVLTTVAAFTPMFFVPGVSGQFFRVIPAIVVSVLMISLVESFFILPAHLSHDPKNRVLWKRMLMWGVPLGLVGMVAVNKVFAGAVPPWRGLLLGLLVGASLPIMMTAVGAMFTFFRGFTQRMLQWFIDGIYRPTLAMTIRYRYLGFAGSMAISSVAFAMCAGGRVKFTFMPAIESDFVSVQVWLPYGSPADATQGILDRISTEAQMVLDAHRTTTPNPLTLAVSDDKDSGLSEDDGKRTISRGVVARLGYNLPATGPVRVGDGGAGGHVGYVQVFMVPSAERDLGAVEFVRQWRAGVGELPGLDRISYRSSMGASAGMPVDVKLIHDETAVLETAAADLAQRLTALKGVKDIDSGFQRGKPQIDFALTPLGEAMGLTKLGVGLQVRAAFFGAEVTRQQRGLDEMKVMVRLPEDGRTSEYDIEELMLMTPAGGEIPFRLAATLKRGYAFTTIKRADERRAINVRADLDRSVTSEDQVHLDLTADDGPLAALVNTYPGLSYDFAGERKERAESMGSLASNGVLALILIFALIAIPFGSYLQPIAIMSVIPMAVAMAIFGHAFMGYDLSMISTMGMIALAGVVINDSIVLIDAINVQRDKGDSTWDALIHAGTRRFRPIILTSFTTFFGLAPMILETSVQARFLIPMAISLGFGILLALPFVLLTVPAVYAILEDVKRLLGQALPLRSTPAQSPSGPGSASSEGSGEGEEIDRTAPTESLPGLTSEILVKGRLL